MHEQNELQQIISDILSLKGISLLFVLAVFFIWKSKSKRDGVRTGSGETRLSHEDQLVNFYATQENQGNKVTYIEETEDGFKARVTESDGNRKSWEVKRNP